MERDDSQTIAGRDLLMIRLIKDAVDREARTERCGAQQRGTSGDTGTIRST